jgi:beta-glucanase (GH16 family)
MQFLPIGISSLKKTNFKTHADSLINSTDWTKADGWMNGGAFNCKWRSDNIKLIDEKMVLSINEDMEGSQTKYSGGELRSNAKFGYGLYEVSMKPAKNTGVVSSFFTYTGPSDNNPWDEIDIEFLGKDTTKVQFNYYTNGVGGHEYIYNLGFDASEAYHTYSFEWKKDSIVWRVDGNVAYTAYDNIPSHPGKIMINLWNGAGVDKWLGAYDGKVPIIAFYEWIAYKEF